MKSLDKKTLKDSGYRMMFDLNEEELTKLESTINFFSNQINQSDKIYAIKECAPMTFPFDCVMTYLREDIPNGKVDRDELFKNTKDVVDGQIRLPKVVG